MPADGPPATLTPLETAHALAEDCVVRWWQVTSFVELAGPDAVTLLDGLCTQAVERIAPGTSRLGLLLDAKAHIIAPVVIHRASDAPWTDPRGQAIVDTAPRLLLETLPELVEPLRSHLTKYRLRARATIEPVELATLAVIGPAAPTLPGDAGGAWFDLVGPGPMTHGWIGDPAMAHALLSRLTGELELGLADPATLEALRITSGVVSLHDLLAGRMPAEVGGMDDAVALDAGCYLGQEPVARLHYRGHANRTLRQLTAPQPIAPVSGDEDALELRRADDDGSGRVVGRLTTWSELPDGTGVAFAMLRREIRSTDDLAIAGTSTSLRALEPLAADGLHASDAATPTGG